MMDEKKRITIWLNPCTKVGESQYGKNVDWLDWLELEAERMKRNGLEVEINFNDKHECALFRKEDNNEPF